MAADLADTLFLVSGGARGVTARCVVELARAHGSAFLLLGRTPRGAPSDLPADEAAAKAAIAERLLAAGEPATPAAIGRRWRTASAQAEIEHTLAAVAEAGGRAEYLEVDVTDAAAVRAAVAGSALAAAAGPVTGVLHGAGVLADKRIEKKTRRDVAAVWGPKVHGLRSLLAAVDPERLAWLLLFSSASAVHGNPGQADYAAANAVLDALAHAVRRRRPGCRTVAFDWGPWDGGMVTPTLAARFAALGVPVLPPDEGARRFVAALADPDGPPQRVVNDAPVPAAHAPRALPRAVSRRLPLAGHPFLADHVVNGNPVLPAACAAHWAARVAAAAHPGFEVVSVSELRVLKGVVFDEAVPDGFTAVVTPLEVGADTLAETVSIESRAPDGRPRYHYPARFDPARARPAPPFAPAPSAALAPRDPYADGHLFHGPTFRALVRVGAPSPAGLVATCRHTTLGPDVLGAFADGPFCPVCLDAALQVVGLWAHDVEGAVALPSRLDRVEVFGPPPDDAELVLTAAVVHRGRRAVRADVTLADPSGRVVLRVRGAELTYLGAGATPAAGTAPPAGATGPGTVASAPRPPGPPPVAAAPPRAPPEARGATDARWRPEPPPRAAAAAAHRLPEDVAVDPARVLRALRRLDVDCHVVRVGNQLGVSLDANTSATRLTTLPALPPERFGSAAFLRDHGVRRAYMAGAMAKGIAGEDLVIALGRAGLLGSYGAGGLPLDRTEAAITRVQEALGDGPYAFNLLHSPNKREKEEATVDLYLRRGVRTVEASSYVDLTPAIVRYRALGLAPGPDGVRVGNRVIVKLSRLELARRFLEPAPAALLRRLVEEGRITAEHAALAARVPMADDLTFEADSGGHTDNRALLAGLPGMLRLRDEVQAERRYATPVRVGAAGGIGTPHAALAAFMAGADYVVTGSINQACVEAGTSAHVKALLAGVAPTDVAMAPESDGFEQGVRVQVVKKGTLFAMRAQRLLECYRRYDGLGAIPEAERRFLETNLFGASLEETWARTHAFLAANRPEKLARAHDERVRMALTFKWYLGQSSRWAVDADPERQMDYQVWCGPAMGAFNEWARGTYLAPPENRRVADVARVLLNEAAWLWRLQLVRMHGFGALVAA